MPKGAADGQMIYRGLDGPYDPAVDGARPHGERLIFWALDLGLAERYCLGAPNGTLLRARLPRSVRLLDEGRSDQAYVGANPAVEDRLERGGYGGVIHREADTISIGLLPETIAALDVDYISRVDIIDWMEEE